MDFEMILTSLKAFYVNGFNHLMYMLSKNISIILIIMAAVFTALLLVKEVVIMNVRDEQNIM